MNTTHYRALPGRSKSAWGVLWLIDLVLLAGQSSLAASHQIYQGPDHLLLVENKFFNESVKRFFFNDIQAIVVRRTRTHATVNIVLALLMVLLVILAAVRLSQDWNLVALAVVSAVEALLLALLIVNVWLGPTCRTELLTAVHRQPLINLRRWRTTAGFVRQVDSLVRQAQQTSAVGTREDAAAQPVQWLAANFSDPPQLFRRQAAAPALDLRTPALYFTLLLACSISSVVDALLYNDWKNSADAILYTATLLCGSLALGQIRHIERLGTLRNLLATGITLMIVLFYAAQIVMMIEMFSQIDPGSPAVYFKPPKEITPFMMGYALVCVLVYGILGLFGLVQAASARRYSH